MNSNRDYFLSTECFYVEMIGQHSSKFLVNNNIVLQKNQGFQNCAWVNAFILQNLVFIWSFHLKYEINTVYLLILFKCDLNLAVNITTEK